MLFYAIMNFVLLLLTGCAAATTADPDPCVSHSTLDGTLRDIKRNNTGTPLCDQTLTPGWYRFSHGEIATSKVSINHCGTISNIWMDDKFPDKGQTSKRKFCFNNMDLVPTGCLWSMQTPVKNCGTFFVYKFPIPSTLCPMAACVDTSVKPCSAGQISTSGFPPCKSTTPSVTSVTLSPPEEDAWGNFNHACTVTSSNTEPEARFKVTWSMDNVPVSTTVLAGLEREATFPLGHWQGHINKHLTCTVTAYYESSKDLQSKSFTSNNYYGGIKVEPSSVVLNEGTDQVIDVISTLPLNCEDPQQSHMCHLKLYATSPDLYTKNGCELTFTPTHWNDTTHEARVPLEISSNVDPANKPTVVTELVLVVTFNETIAGLEVWSNATAISTKEHAVKMLTTWCSRSAYETSTTAHVTVQDRKSKYCVASGDPHFLQSFSKDQYYNLYHLGDFNFASDMRVPIVIQIENGLYSPTDRPMVSSVAIQTDDDVTIFDTNGGFDPLSITSRKPPTSHTVMTCGTNEYMVITPTGHRVEISNSGLRSWLVVRVYFPDDVKPFDGNFNSSRSYHETCDVKDTTGGVLSFSGNTISGKVIDKHRVDPSQNLFKGAVLSLKRDTSNGLTSQKTIQYCSCSHDNVDQTVHTTCSTTQKLDDPALKRPGCKVIIPQVSPPPLPERPRERDWDSYVPPPTQWPTRSGITESKAREVCRQAIFKHVSPQCSAKMKDISIDGDVTACVEDIQATDSFDYVISAVHGYQFKCESDILSDKSNYNNATGLPDIIAEKCPEYCSMHGTCVKGTCHCEAGWGFDDCSVKASEPFKINGINGGILCDKSVSHECFKLLLQVQNLANISHCTAQPYKYKEGRPGSQETTYTGNHDRHTATSVMCDIHSNYTDTYFPAMQFRIGLMSESTSQPAQYIDYVVYDGTCQRCLEDGTCFMKQNSCLIEDRCYRNGDMKTPGNSTVVCDPSSNMDGWTLQ